MILEGLISTVDEAGRPHLAAMGPRVDDDFSRFEIRPYLTSSTARYLASTPFAVFHVTDDVELIAATVAGRQPTAEQWQPAAAIPGYILTAACRAYELKVVHRSDAEPRGMMVCAVERVHRFRDFFGLNRAKHAVIEAAILASRVDFLPRSEIESQWDALRTLVEKTGGDAEHRAFELLTAFLERTYQDAASAR